MKLVHLLVCILFCSIFSSCGDEEINPTPPDVLDYFVVASHPTLIIDSITNQTVECFIVKYIDQKDWFTLKKENIRNFEYQEGFEYEIEVRTIDLNEGKDIPLYGYEVVKIISKEKKETEGLPEEFK